MFGASMKLDLAKLKKDRAARPVAEAETEEAAVADAGDPGVATEGDGDERTE